VINTKDIITNALPTIGTLQNTIVARQMNLSISKWYGASDDILQTISMPVFLIVQAIQSMAEVKEVGDKEAAEKKRALILEILGIVFALIPFLDDLTPAIEGLDGVLGSIAAAGNAASAIQGIIADPSSAPMEILGALTAGGVRDEEDFADMAAARRAISSDDLTKIGATFEKMDSDFHAIIKRDCKL
jgi:glucan 1,3-beta-glucosidase